MQNLTSLQAMKPLTKIFKSPTEVTSYPLVSKCSSFDHQYDPNNINTFADVIRQVATNKGCLLKGPLKKQLTSESRAGHSDKNAVTRWIMIDVDGLVLPGVNLPTKVSAKELQNAADTIIDELPACFTGVSYVAQASSSFGLKGNSVSLHLFFILSAPIAPFDLKQFLRQINFESDLFSKNIKLSGNSRALSWPIDPSVADNSKLVFVTDPKFHNLGDDPFISPTDRIYVHTTDKPTVDLSATTLWDANKLRLETEKYLKNLRQGANLSSTPTKQISKAYGGEMIDYIKNPDPCTIEILDDTHLPYVRCNVNGGDSGGYFIDIRNPKVMRNFKGEPYFFIEDANPSFLEGLYDHYGLQMETYREGKRPIVFRDHASGAYYNGLYDSDANEWDETFYLVQSQAQALNGFLQGHGGDPLEGPAPEANLTFDPHSTDNRVQFDKSPYYINSFSPSEYMKNAKDVKVQQHTMDDADALQKICPTIYQILDHVCGNDPDDYKHFINWLAYCFQTREKSGVAWVFSGVPGTGKGVMFNYIVRPLWGDIYALPQNLSAFEDEFNEQLSRAMIIAVDEFRDSNAQGKKDRIVQKVKEMITEPMINIRRMRANRVAERSYANFLFFTNAIDAISIEAGDRRYEVATPQRKPLIDVMPTIAFDLDPGGKIELELNAFSGFLQHFDVVPALARRPRLTKAKQTMRSATMDHKDEFISAVQAGDFEFFREVLSVSTKGVLNPGAIIGAQQAVQKLAESVVAGTKPLMQPGDLHNIYNTLGDPKDSLGAKGFKRLMGLTNVARKQFMWPDGSKRESYLLDSFTDTTLAQDILDESQNGTQ